MSMPAGAPRRLVARQLVPRQLVPRQLVPRQLVAVIVVGLLLPVLMLAVTVSAPTDGAVSDLADPGWETGRVTVTTVFGPPSGLRAADEVVAVAGVPLAQRVDGAPLDGVRSGDRLTYTVTRSTGDGTAGTRQVDVTVTVLDYPVTHALRRLAPELPLIVVTFVLYAFVLWRRPEDPTARALFAMAVLLPLSQAAAPMGMGVLDVARGRLWPYLVSDVCNLALWGVLLRIVLLFPTPPPMVSRRPWLLPAAHALPLVTALPKALLAADPDADPLRRVSLLAGLSVPAANTVPLLVVAILAARYLTSRDPLTRRRMRWAVVALFLGAVAYLGLGQLPARQTGQPLVPWAWQGLFLLPCPFAVGAAVLRHRLFDIEVVLRRSLVYGALTLTLGLAYLGTVAGLGRALGTPDLTPMVAGALVTALFQPLRSRLRRAVSTVVFGNRDDPAEVLHRLGDQLEAAGAAPGALPHLLATLRDTLRLSYAAIELDSAPGLGARVGELTGSAMTIPLTDRGEEIGRLVLDPGAAREPFGPRDRRLVEGLARQVTVVAQNLLLTHRLQRSLGRTVTALEEQRRRLRRDLHDGLGPTLASGALRADLARRLLRTDPARAEEILAGLADGQRLAIRELRVLVEGLRPAALDQLGLVGALAEQAARFTAESGGSLSMRVDAAGEFSGLPAAVEVAAYRIATEALTNIVRHAGATRCELSLADQGAEGLLVRVSDDGRGLADGYRAGVGLTSMRERATELGGRLRVGPHPDGSPGTLLLATLPCPAGDPDTPGAGPRPAEADRGARPKWFTGARPDKVEVHSSRRPVGGSAMTDAGSTGRVQPAEDAAWVEDAEVPDADADEQRRELVDNPDEADPETVAGRDRSDQLREPPLEVSEADFAEQLADVPFDDDVDRA